MQNNSWHGQTAEDGQTQTATNTLPEFKNRLQLCSSRANRPRYDGKIGEIACAREISPRHIMWSQWFLAYGAKNLARRLFISWERFAPILACPLFCYWVRSPYSMWQTDRQTDWHDPYCGLLVVGRFVFYVVGPSVHLCSRDVFSLHQLIYVKHLSMCIGCLWTHRAML